MSKKKNTRKKSPSKRPRGPSPDSKLHELRSLEDFQRVVVAGSRPAIIDFWAPWCGPCKITAPHFAAAARELGDEILFCKVDTDRARSLAKSFAIKSIPTLAVVVDGKIVARHVGATQRDGIEALARKGLKIAARGDAPEGLVSKLKGIFGS